MPKVLNDHKDRSSSDAVYIGRPSKWGNPFVIGKDGSREDVLLKYRLWFLSNPALIKEAKKELKGKDLICFCKPKPCHGDLLLKIANEEILPIDSFCEKTNG